MDLCIHSPTRLHGIVLNLLSTVQLYLFTVYVFGHITYTNCWRGVINLNNIELEYVAIRNCIKVIYEVIVLSHRAEGR
jgi:hypothetical protein